MAQRLVKIAKELNVFCGKKRKGNLNIIFFPDSRVHVAFRTVKINTTKKKGKGNEKIKVTLGDGGSFFEKISSY